MTDRKPKPIYVIFGADTFLRDQYRAEITAEVLGDADPQTCLCSYDGSADLAAVLDDLRTLPLLGTRRLVVVTDAEDFISAHRDKLEAYLNAPSANGTLLLMAKSFPANTRLAKRVAKIGVKADCSPLGGKDVGGFIRDQATARGRRIGRPAEVLMAEWLGADRARIVGELDKLTSYTEGRDTITDDDVAAVVVATAGVNPFALADALAAGDAKAALGILERLLTQRGEEYRVLGLIGWHLRRAMKAKQMLAAGRGEADVFKAVNIFYQSRQAYRHLFTARSLTRICGDFRELIRTDLAIKTGRDGKAALQRLVVALC